MVRESGLLTLDRDLDAYRADPERSLLVNFDRLLPAPALLTSAFASLGLGFTCSSLSLSRRFAARLGLGTFPSLSCRLSAPLGCRLGRSRLPALFLLGLGLGLELGAALRLGRGGLACECGRTECQLQWESC